MVTVAGVAAEDLSRTSNKRTKLVLATGKLKESKFTATGKSLTFPAGEERKNTGIPGVLAKVSLTFLEKTLNSLFAIDAPSEYSGCQRT